MIIRLQGVLVRRTIDFCRFTALLAITGTVALGQGTYIFANRIAPEAPVSIMDTTTGECVRPEGDAWHIQLLAGPQGTPLQNLQPVGPILSFMAGARAGYAFPSLVIVPGSGNQLEDVLVRVYSGTDWASSVSRAEAGPFTLEIIVPPGSSPNLPLELNSLNFCVPEPSTLSLGLSGLGLYLFRIWYLDKRRSKSSI